MTAKERSILTVSCYGHFLSHLNMLVFPAILLPLAAQMELSMTETLQLSFWMYLLFGVSALPWGAAADYFGPRRLLSLFHVGAAASALFAAFTVHDPLLFCLALTGIGLFSGIYHPAGLGWIAKELENTSRGMAYNGMAGNLGLAVAPLLAGLLNYFFNISLVYAVVAGMNLVGLIFTIRHKEAPQDPKADHECAATPPTSWTPFLILLCAMMLGGIAYRGTSVTLPAFFELKNAGVYDMLKSFFGDLFTPNLSATILTSILFLIGMGGQYLGGRVGEKYDLRWSYLVFHLITIPAAFAMSASADWALFLWATIHGFFLLGMQPIENTLLARLTPPQLLSSAYGTKFVFTFGVGALSVKMLALVRQSWGIDAIFIAIALVSTLLCFVICLLIRNTSGTRQRFR